MRSDENGRVRKASGKVLRARSGGSDPAHQSTDVIVRSIGERQPPQHGTSARVDREVQRPFALPRDGNGLDDRGAITCPSSEEHVAARPHRSGTETIAAWSFHLGGPSRKDQSVATRKRRGVGYRVENGPVGQQGRHPAVIRHSSAQMVPVGAAGQCEFDGQRGCAGTADHIGGPASQVEASAECVTLVVLAQSTAVCAPRC